MANSGCPTLAALALRERELGFADDMFRAGFERRCPDWFDWVAELARDAKCARLAFTECTRVAPTE